MDQASELRALRQDSLNISKDSFQTSALKITSVTGGKGGVGKSNVALNLAIALTRKGEKVCILDADFGLANIDVLLGIKPRFNISHVITGEKTLEETIYKTDSGVSIIPASSGLKQLADLSEDVLKSFTDQAKALGKTFDRIIIDTPAGISHNVITFLLASTEVIVVATPEPTSITDSYALLKTFKLERGAGKLMMVMNMCRTESEGQIVGSNLIKICHNFLGTKPLYLGSILFDIELVNAIRRQKPVMIADPNGKAATQISRISVKLKTIESEKNDLGDFFNSFKAFVSK